MLQLSDAEVSIHLCTFQAYFQKAKVNLRFPSLFFVQWKTINAKNAVTMLTRKRAVNSQVELDETLNFTTEMLYHRTQKQYLKKESLIHLNLISHSRPDQVKLVGRVVVDLAEIANSRQFESVTTLKLMYCSVDADISFRAKLSRSLDSNLELNELDRSSFSDLYSFTTNKNQLRSRVERRDSLMERRSEGEKGRIRMRGSEKEEGSAKIRNSVKESKIDNILIKEQPEEAPEERNKQYSHISLALSERRPTNPLPAQPTTPTISALPSTTPVPAATSSPAFPPTPTVPQPRPPPPPEAPLDAISHKQKQILQHQLNEHKIRIKKLQTDFIEVRKLFEESEEKSEVNRCKLAQSENVLSELHEKYREEIRGLKEMQDKELQQAASRYDADVQVLQGSVEQERLKAEDIAQRSRKTIEEFGELAKQNEEIKEQLKENQQFVAQFADIKKQSSILQQQKQSILEELAKKDEQIAQLRIANHELKQQYEEQTVKFHELQSQLALLTADLTNKTAQIQALSVQLAQTASNNQTNISTECKQQEIPAQLAQNPAILQHQAALIEKQATIQQQSRVISQQTAKIDELSNKNVEVTANIADLIDKLNVATSQYSQLRESMMEEQLKLQQQLEEYNLHFTTIKEEHQQRYDQILKELCQSKQENQRLIEANIKNSTPIANLNEEISKASQLKEEELTKMKEDKLKIQQQLQELKKSANTQISPAVPDVSQELLQSKSEEERLKGELLLQQDKCQQHTLELIEVKHENTTLKEKLDRIILEYEQFKSSSHKEPSPAPNNKKQAEVELLKEELIKEKEAKQQANDLLNNLQMKIAELNMQLTTLKAEAQFNESVKHQLEFYKETIHTLSAENEELRVQKTKINRSPALEVVQTITINQLPASDPIKIEQPKQSLPLEVRPSPLEQKEPSPADIQPHPTTSLIPLNLQKSLNSSGEVFEQPYNFNFDHQNPLTHEEINQISEIKGFHQNEDQVNALKEENYRLKEEIQEIKSEYLGKEAELKAQIEEIKSKIEKQALRFEETIKQLEREKEMIRQDTTKEVSNLKDRINQLTAVPAIPQQESQLHTKIEELTHQIQFYRHQNTELDQTIKQLKTKNEQLQKQSKLYEQHSQDRENDRQNALLRELEYRLTNLEEELKIKDELLADTEKNLEENYAVKYELAELKEKYSEIKVALDQRDDIINQLEEAKEQLSKELEIFTERSHHAENYIESNPINEQPPQIHMPQANVQAEITDLKQEVEALRGELINLNNRNSELIASCQDATNQRNQIERANQELKSIINDAEAAVRELSSLKEAQQMLDREASNVAVQLQTERSKIAEELAYKDASLKMIGEELALKQLKILQLNQANSILVYQIDHLTVKNSELTSQMSALKQQSERNKQNVDLHHDDQRLIALQQQKNQLEIKNAQLVESLASIQGYSTHLIQELKSLHLKMQGINDNEARLVVIDAELQQAYSKAENSSKQLEQANAKAAEATAELTKLQSTIQRLQQENQQPITQERNLSLNSQVISNIDVQPQEIATLQLPNLQIHQVDSNVNEALPIEYENSTIPFVYNPSAESIEREEHLRKENESLKQEVEKLLKEVGALEEQKFAIYGEKQALKEKILELDREIGIFKEQNDKMTALPLQSFDQTPKNKYPYSAQTLNSQQDPKQTSILLKVNVKAGLSPTKIETNQLPSGKQGSQVTRLLSENQQVSTKFLQKEEYQQKITELIKSLDQTINKTAVLEENISYLEKELQEQIQINQINEKVTEKLQALNDLQSMAVNFNTEIEELKRQNEELQRTKQQNQVLLAEKAELLKLAEDHVLCQQEKAEWQQKLDRIEVILSENEQRYQSERYELENKIKLLQQYITHLETPQSVAHSNERAAVQQNEENLRAENDQLKAERLNQLEQITNLQEKLNKLTEQHSQKDLQMNEALTLKQQQLEEFHFINQQLKHEIKELKTIQEATRQRNPSQEYVLKYEKDIAELQKKLKESSQKMIQMHAEFEQQVVNFKQQLNIIQEEKNQITMEMSAELDKMQIELAQRVNAYEEMEKNIASYQEEINCLREQLQFKLEAEKVTEEDTRATGDDTSKTNIKIVELSTKNSQLQNDLIKRQKEISELTQKLITKQAQIAKLTNESEQWKSQCERNQTKMRLLAQKESSMKETMMSVQTESRKLIQSLQNRSQSEEGYYRKYLQKESECNRLSVAAAEAKEEMDNKDRMIAFLQQQADQMKNELDIIKRAVDPQISPTIATIEYEKYERLLQSNEQLMNKNREYLELLNNKSSINVENEQLKGEVKLINAKINEISVTYTQLKQNYEIKLTDITSKLEKANQEIAELKEELSRKNEHIANVEKIISEKEAVRSLQEQNKIDQNKHLLSISESTVNNLTEQVLSLTQQFLKKQDEIRQLRGENEQLRSIINQNNQNIRQVEVETVNFNAQAIGDELSSLKKKEEEYRSIIADLQQQLTAQSDKNKPSLPQKPIEIQPSSPLKLTTSPQQSPQVANNQNMTLLSQDLHLICSDIKQLCKTRSNTPQSKKIVQSFIHKYDLIEQQFSRMNNQTSCIQQKAKFISKQLQKVKSYVIKSTTRAFKEKTELLALLKPCENAVGELINLSQTLNERDSQSYA